MNDEFVENSIDTVSKWSERAAKFIRATLTAFDSGRHGDIACVGRSVGT